MPRQVFDDVQELEKWCKEFVKRGQYTVYTTSDNELILEPRKSTRPQRFVYIKTVKERYGPTCVRNPKKVAKKKSQIHLKLWKNEEYRDKIVSGCKRWWDEASSKEKEERIHSFRSAQNIKPNKQEKILITFLSKHNLPYNYHGNHPYSGLEGKCPDFVHESESKIIEFFGDYWHDENHEKERIEFFKQFGYSCLVIWQHELGDKELLLEKIREFDSNE